jgi:hypothetical protein
MMATVTCPRCDLANRGTTPEGNPGNEGFIFWEDATDAERDAALATGLPEGGDDDSEIPCPLCDREWEHVDEQKAQEWHDSQKPPVEPAIRGLDWADVPNPDDIPPAKFRFEWEDDNNASVIAIPPEPSEPVRIGLLSWDADSWCFTRIDRTGVQLVGADTIECDAEAEAELRKAHEDALTTGGGEAVLTAKVAALDTQRDLYRDDSRDIAELGARIVARKWWRLFYTVED